MTDKERKILDLIEAHQPAKPSILATMLGISQDNLRKHVSALRGRGLVRRQGHSVHVRYSVAGLRVPAHKALRPYEQAASVWEYARRCANS